MVKKPGHPGTSEPTNRIQEGGYAEKVIVAIHPVSKQHFVRPIKHNCHARFGSILFILTRTWGKF
jgi:hypothetical protein